MLVYMAAMGLAAWLVPKLLVMRWQSWWVVLLSILLGWTVAVGVGVGILAIEIPTLGGAAALERFSTGFLVALVVSIWTALANRKKKKITQDIEVWPDHGSPRYNLKDFN